MTLLSSSACSESASRLRVAVVGAGMAGLVAARTLQDQGHQVVVFDKGRGPGGRTATRRKGKYGFDHGAQYFTARHPALKRWIPGWLEEGGIAEWNGRLVAAGSGGIGPIRGSDQRYVGTPGMNALARHMAADLDIRQRLRVVSIERAVEGWSLDTAETGRHDGFDYLLVTAPPAQAAALVTGVSALGARAEAFQMRPCWALMLVFGAPLGVDYDGAFCEDDMLSWIARDSSKPGRAAGERWIVHAGPEWSEAHLEDDPDTVAEALTAALARISGVALPPIEHRQAHRWRYALPAQPASESCLFEAEQGLALAGDAYNGGRIEGAWLSGIAAAECILEDAGRDERVTE